MLNILWSNKPSLGYFNHKKLFRDSFNVIDGLMLVIIIEF